jgi:hypothetical protein
MDGYPLPVLDGMPLQSVLALYSKAGRIRRDRLHDAFLSAGQNEIASMMRG